MTVRLKPVGFRELLVGAPDAPSIKDHLEARPAAEEAAILGYLEAAPEFVVGGRLVDDVLDPSRRGVAEMGSRTDGEWEWSTELAYYVRNYHVSLAPEFLASMRERGWLPPSLTEEDLVALADANGPPPPDED